MIVLDMILFPSECDCAHTHGSCHRDTGECICPPHTEGEKCETCEEGYWGHDPVSGCKVPWDTFCNLSLSVCI